MAGPEDEMAASTAGRWAMRASDADREQAIEALKIAFVHGRMAEGELGSRVGQALAARTCAELAALTADIPPVPAVLPVPAAPRPVRPLAVPARRRPLAAAAARSGCYLALAAAAGPGPAAVPGSRSGPGPGPAGGPARARPGRAGCRR